ncbi:hypothetical protein CMK14_16945 [Candidatus Poribacteria bacterium]|nr:hypothetical protein [Candidatus Poribacteria bacterium]
MQPRKPYQEIIFIVTPTSAGVPIRTVRGTKKQVSLREKRRVTFVATVNAGTIEFQNLGAKSDPWHGATTEAILTPFFITVLAKIKNTFSLNVFG